jgi:hypothetical protein
MTDTDIEKLQREVAALKENYVFLVHYYQSKIATKIAERDRLISKKC